MDFYINSYLPSTKKDIQINKLSFGDFFQLNSYIENSDNMRSSETFDLICEKSIGNLSGITNLDKFYTLVNLYLYYISPLLKISAKNKNSEKVVYEIFLKNVLLNCKKYESNGFILPLKMYYDDAYDIMGEIGKNDNEIEEQINSNKILIYDIPSMLTGIPKMHINCFDNTLFYFCKLLYKTNLKGLYDKISKLKKNFNFLLSEIYEMSPKELDFFLKTK